MKKTNVIEAIVKTIIRSPMIKELFLELFDKKKLDLDLKHFNNVIQKNLDSLKKWNLIKRIMCFPVAVLRKVMSMQIAAYLKYES